MHFQLQLLIFYVSWLSILPSIICDPVQELPQLFSPRPLTPSPGPRVYSQHKLLSAKKLQHHIAEWPGPNLQLDFFNVVQHYILQASPSGNLPLRRKVFVPEPQAYAGDLTGCLDRLIEQARTSIATNREALIDDNGFRAVIPDGTVTVGIRPASLGSQRSMQRWDVAAEVLEAIKIKRGTWLPPSASFSIEVSVLHRNPAGFFCFTCGMEDSHATALFYITATTKQRSSAVASGVAPSATT